MKLNQTNMLYKENDKKNSYKWMRKTVITKQRFDKIFKIGNNEIVRLKEF